MLAVLLSAALAGLLSSPHCAAMCGPLCARGCNSRPRALRGFLLGRFVAYAALGAVVAVLGSSVLRNVWSGPSTTILSWVLAAILIAAALRAWPFERRKLVTISRRTQRPLIARLASRLPARPEILGGLTVVLPCAALWSAAAVAAASGHPLLGALALVTFAATSAIGLVLSSWFAARARKSPIGSRLLAAAFVAGALLCVWRPLHFAPAEANVATPAPSCPLHAGGSI